MPDFNEGPILHLTIRMPVSEETIERLRPLPLDWDKVREVVLDSEPNVDLYHWDFDDGGKV